MASVSLRHVSKTYKSGVAALRDCNLEVADGEFLVVAGPAGCGKSALLRIVAGLDIPDEGDIYIGNARVNLLQPKERDIAMVLQNNALYPDLTVSENLAFSLRMHKMPEEEIERRVREVADVLEIADCLDRKPGALSPVQQQHVALARAMVRGQKVLLLDEPLANLDPKLRMRMRAGLKALHKRLGLTILYSTRDQEEAMEMGGRIVVLKDGFVQQVGVPRDLYNAPVNQFVAEFLGAPQMNFLNVKVGAQGEYYSFTFGKSAVRLPKERDKGGSLKGYVGKNITLGVRPEDVHDTPEDLEKMPDGVVTAEVEALEPAGEAAYLSLTCAGHSVTARVEPDAVRQSGEQIQIAFDMRQIYLFDGETERMIFHEMT